MVSTQNLESRGFFIDAINPTSSPTEPTKAKRRPRLKLTPDETSGWVFIEQAIDLVDCVVESLFSNDGHYFQMSNDALEAVKNGPHPSKLSQTNFVLHARGLHKVYGHSRYNAGFCWEDGRFIAGVWQFIRIDLDVHHPESGERLDHCLPFIESLTQHGFNLCPESSPRGIGAYTTIRWPARTTIAQMNLTVKHLETTLKKVAQMYGYKISIEVQGGLNVIRGERGHRKVISRAKPIKLPRCEDATKLRSAVTQYNTVFSFIWQYQSLPEPVQAVSTVSDPRGPTPAPTVSSLDQTMQETFAAMAQQEAMNALEAKTLALYEDDDEDDDDQPAKPAKRNKKRVKDLTNADKFTKRRWGVILACEKLLTGKQHNGIGVSDDLLCRLVDLANEIYETNGWNTGTRDSERDASFKSILTSWYFKNHNPKRKRGKSKLWFKAEFDPDRNTIVGADYDRGEQLMRSLYPQHVLDRVNSSPVLPADIFALATREHRSELLDRYAKRMKDCPVTYRALAIAFLTLAKDINTNNGQVSKNAVTEMLIHFEVPVCRESVTQIMTLLTSESSKVFTCTNYGHSVGHCRTYAITSDLVWSLPFLIELKPTKTEIETVLLPQLERYVGPGRANDSYPSFYIDRVSGTSFITDFDFTDASEQEQARIMAEIEQEQADEQEFQPTNVGALRAQIIPSVAIAPMGGPRIKLSYDPLQDEDSPEYKAMKALVMSRPAAPMTEDQQADRTARLLSVAAERLKTEIAAMD